jgi:hypothetical protein
MYDDISVTLGYRRSAYSEVKSWVASCRIEHLSNEDEERSGGPTQIIIPEDVDAIHAKILCDIPRRGRLYYSRDFRHEKALRQMGPQMSQCCEEA